jgi:hypothetical protein
MSSNPCGKKTGGHVMPPSAFPWNAGLPAGGDEQHEDDAHGLLGVVAAVAERIERSRNELEAAETSVDGAWTCPHEDP